LDWNLHQNLVFLKVKAVNLVHINRMLKFWCTFFFASLLVFWCNLKHNICVKMGWILL
jgi:hypothetical protein